MDKRKRTKTRTSTHTSHEAKLAVAQTYWTADQDYKAAEAKRDHVRGIALLALRKGETVGPVHTRRAEDAEAEAAGHWLTHGEKERVEMDPGTLCKVAALFYPNMLQFMTVDVAEVKAVMPKIYAKMLKHKTTRRTRHSCLTWSATPPKRRGAV